MYFPCVFNFPNSVYCKDVTSTFWMNQSGKCQLNWVSTLQMGLKCSNLVCDGHMTWYILNISNTFLSQDIAVTSVWYIYVKSDVGLHISLPLRSSEIMSPLWTTSVLTFECVSTSSSTLWCGKFILCFIWINSFVFSAHYFVIHALQRTGS